MRERMRSILKSTQYRSVFKLKPLWYTEPEILDLCLMEFLAASVLV